MAGAASPIFELTHKLPSSCSETPDQSPITPFAIPAGFLQYFSFSSYADLTRGPVIPMMYCAPPVQGGKLQLPAESAGDTPVWVNARQYHRILRRRMTRRLHNAQPRIRRTKSYIHESRHRHACKRERGPSGMFLPKSPKPQVATFLEAALAAYEKGEEVQ